MGKRSRRYEEEMRFGRCDICGNNLPLEFYCDRGDTVFCDDCSSEYVIKSRRPLRLMLLDSDYDDEYFGDLDFN